MNVQVNDISRSENLCVAVGSLIANPMVIVYHLCHPNRLLGEGVNRVLGADVSPNLYCGQSRDLSQQSLHPFHHHHLFLVGHWEEQGWSPLANDPHLGQQGLLLPSLHHSVVLLVRISSHFEREP
jgi:hypothetical protein